MSQFVVIVLSGSSDIKAIHGCPDMKSVRDIVEFFNFKYKEPNISIHVYKLLEV